MNLRFLKTTGEIKWRRMNAWKPERKFGKQLTEERLSPLVAK
jgi:hypothetical protein